MIFTGTIQEAALGKSCAMQIGRFDGYPLTCGYDKPCHDLVWPGSVKLCARSMATRCRARNQLEFFVLCVWPAILLSVLLCV